MQRLNGNRKKVMGKRCSLGLFCFAVFIAFGQAFAQIEAISEKDKPRVRKWSASRPAFPWKTNIVTTVFWIGERPGGNNLVPNHTSAWDKQWAKNYGGFDDPNPAHRRNYVPIKFTPRQNPFYCALPYNDKAHTGHQAGSVSCCSVVSRGVPGSGSFHLQGPMDRHPQGQSNRLCTVGRRRTIPNGPLAIRIWQ